MFIRIAGECKGGSGEEFKAVGISIDGEHCWLNDKGAIVSCGTVPVASPVTLIDAALPWWPFFDMGSPGGSISATSVDASGGDVVG